MCFFKKSHFFKRRISEFDREFFDFASSYFSEDVFEKIDFVRAVHLRCPFSVEFIEPDEVSVFFIMAGSCYRFRSSVSVFQELISYAFKHIDDVL